MECGLEIQRAEISESKGMSILILSEASKGFSKTVKIIHISTVYEKIFPTHIISCSICHLVRQGNSCSHFHSSGYKDEYLFIYFMAIFPIYIHLKQ